MVNTTRKPKEGYKHKVPVYVKEAAPQVAALVATPVIRVYQNFIPWFGSDRNNATLLYLGKVLGTDYFIHPMSDLAAGIPENTDVILIPSNSAGDAATAAEENDPVAQANLESFVRSGGVLIVDMASNLDEGGFIAPGSEGTPISTIYPSPCANATLTEYALKQPFVNGPVLLDNDNIDLELGCSIAHGNLEQGITMPPNAKVLMTATFDGIERPILAQYCLGKGRVILDTITKEFEGQRPAGLGPSNILVNLFAYALSPAATAPCSQTRGIKLF